MEKRVYIIEAPYIWEYDDIIRLYPNILKYSIKKFPIKQGDIIHYAVAIEIFDYQIIELCNEFECKRLVVDFSKNIFSDYDYPTIIIYDGYIE